ncbi:MAG: long-chain fatty acid--CoA ligase [Acidobacteria bacterium]|nr:long-chain fatty acid--CoA ligase [Acidobacteriota bacterium]MBI3427604.1 long-chain fatty acid--CoA ligase [Acidobacteriota bacterium]
MALTEAPITTLNDLFRQATAADKSGLLNFKKGGQWQTLSAHELAECVHAAAMGLYALDVRAGDRVGILAENSVEWIIADLGVLNCGAADVPIYATQAPKQVQYILQDAGVEVLFISNQAQYDRVRDVLPATKLRALIAFEPIQASGRVLPFEEFLNWGRAAASTEPELYESLSHSVTADSLATLIYTSGTTGDPKGVMLSHGNLLASVLINHRDAELKESETALSFLPFSHIFERSTIYLYLHARVTTYLAESIETVAANLREARPHFFTSVPRLFEKMYAKTLEKAEASGKLTAALAEWSFDLARQWARLASENKPIPALLGFKHKLADKLILSKWRAALGGRIRVLVAGGAALPEDLAYVFYGAGLPIYQGYGLSESSPTISCNNPRENRIGSVGRPRPGVSVRIAEDGEILAAGPNIMQGYYNRPDETAAALETHAEGRVWLHTGDIGHLDADGFLYITDRKKDLLKTSGGKYIAPQPIENALKRSRFINQVVVIGDDRKFPAALIVPQMEMLKSYAELKHIKYADPRELLTQPQIIDLFERQVAKFSGELAQYEKLKGIALLEKELTIESGELTPTLKVKRRVVNEKYRAVIDRLYAEKEAQHAARA